jgi:hypothetical protein
MTPAGSHVIHYIKALISKNTQKTLIIGQNLQKSFSEFFCQIQKYVCEVPLVMA